MVKIHAGQGKAAARHMADAAFEHAATELRMHALGVGNLRALRASLVSLEGALHKATPVDVAVLKDLHHAALLRARRELEDAARSDPAMRGFLDRIFGNALRLSHRSPANVTLMFGDLIRGITFFAEQGDCSGAIAFPAYHRLFSCGPGDDSYRTGRLVCHEDMSSSERNRRRPEIERCYIERLLYDAIYRHEALAPSLAGAALGARAEASQDDGHLFRLDLTHNDFLSCFPGHDVTVDVAFQDGWPMRVTLARSVRGQLVTTDVFEKTLVPTAHGRLAYDAVVECTRTIAANGAVLKKAQGFAREGQWRRAPAPPRPRLRPRTRPVASAGLELLATAAAEARTRAYRPWRTSWDADAMATARPKTARGRPRSS